MAGAIIPTDWDGISFNCQKVVWPSSVMWRAILLGQITEPERESYWDHESGDVDDAVQAIVDAEDLTEPEYWTEYCDVIPGIPVAAFRARKTSTQTILAATWTTVIWQALTYDLNNTNFSLALDAHVPTNEDLIGLWHYDVYIRLLTNSLILVRAIQQPGSVIKARASLAANNRIGTSFDVPHTEGGDQLRIEVWSQVANTIQAEQPDTRFQGHFLGPVSES